MLWLHPELGFCYPEGMREPDRTATIHKTPEYQNRNVRDRQKSYNIRLTGMSEIDRKATVHKTPEYQNRNAQARQKSYST
jgi:hypothetical protein